MSLNIQIYYQDIIIILILFTPPFCDFNVLPTSKQSDSHIKCVYFKRSSVVVRARGLTELALRRLIYCNVALLLHKPPIHNLRSVNWFHLPAVNIGRNGGGVACIVNSLMHVSI